MVEITLNPFYNLIQFAISGWLDFISKSGVDMNHLPYDFADEMGQLKGLSKSKAFIFVSLHVRKVFVELKLRLKTRGR